MVVVVVVVVVVASDGESPAVGDDVGPVCDGPAAVGLGTAVPEAAGVG